MFSESRSSRAKPQAAPPESYYELLPEEQKRLRDGFVPEGVLKFEKCHAQLGSKVVATFGELKALLGEMLSVASWNPPIKAQFAEELVLPRGYRAATISSNGAIFFNAGSIVSDGQSITLKALEDEAKTLCPKGGRNPEYYIVSESSLRE